MSSSCGGGTALSDARSNLTGGWTSEIFEMSLSKMSTPEVVCVELISGGFELICGGSGWKSVFADDVTRKNVETSRSLFETGLIKEDRAVDSILVVCIYDTPSIRSVELPMDAFGFFLTIPHRDVETQRNSCSGQIQHIIIAEWDDTFFMGCNFLWGKVGIK